MGPGGSLRPGRGGRGAPRLWPYTVHWRRPWRRGPADVDPVNLLVLHATPAQVIDRLRGQGWREPTEGGVHLIWVGGWWPRLMAGHLEWGDAGERDHLRLWRLGHHTVGGAHHEVRGAGGRGHRVTSWDAARERAAFDLAATGLRALAPSAVLTPPDLRGRPSDGRVARLSPRGEGSLPRPRSW